MVNRTSKSNGQVKSYSHSKLNYQRNYGEKSYAWECLPPCQAPSAGQQFATPNTKLGWPRGVSNTIDRPLLTPIFTSILPSTHLLFPFLYSLHAFSWSLSLWTWVAVETWIFLSLRSLSSRYLVALETQR